MSRYPPPPASEDERRAQLDKARDDGAIEMYEWLERVGRLREGPRPPIGFRPPKERKHD